MAASNVLDRVLESGLVAVVRSPRGDALADAAAALVDGGVTAVEITFTVPAAHRALEDVARRLGDQVALGAGTVLDPETARIALLSGARYLVTPTLNTDVIALARRHGVPIFSGAFTPTEVLAAHQAGADVVKVFPCDAVGPGYLRALAGPLPHIRLMPTGGVTLATAADFLRAGAVALGLGSALVEPATLARGDWARLSHLARQFVEVVRATREELRGTKPTV